MTSPDEKPRCAFEYRHYPLNGEMEMRRCDGLIGYTIHSPAHDNYHPFTPSPVAAEARCAKCGKPREADEHGTPIDGPFDHSFVAAEAEKPKSKRCIICNPTLSGDYICPSCMPPPDPACSCGHGPRHWRGAEKWCPFASAAKTQGQEKPITAIWSCKIGEAERAGLPKGSDGPMRKAVEAAYHSLTGEWPHFIFSGWGAELTEGERACVENREPEPPPAGVGHTTAQTRGPREHERSERCWCLPRVERYANADLIIHQEWQ